jgi:hypothetical protein
MFCKSWKGGGGISGVPEESLSKVKRHFAPKDLVPEENSKTRDVGTIPRQVNNLRPAHRQERLFNNNNDNKLNFNAILGAVTG